MSDCFAIIQHRQFLLEQFKPFYSSRKYWADILGCSRQTLETAEKKVIRLVFPLLKEYNKQRYLDNYQRFLLCLIYGLSQGWFDGKRYRHEERKEWLKNALPYITREKFEEWIENVYPQSN